MNVKKEIRSERKDTDHLRDKRRKRRGIGKMKMGEKRQWRAKNKGRYREKREGKGREGEALTVFHTDGRKT